jgi:hypothetical protein
MVVRGLIAALVSPLFACGVPSVTFYDDNDAEAGSSDASAPTAESGMASDAMASDAPEGSTACGNMFLGCMGPACDSGAICAEGCSRCKSTEWCCATSQSVTCHMVSCPRP